MAWPPRLPEDWGEVERREAAGYIPSDNGPFFSCTREEFRVELFIAQGGECHWCLQPMSMVRRKTTPLGNVKDNQSFATFEHLRPRFMGGKFNRENIRLAHGSCNLKRHRKKFDHDPYADVLNGLIRASGKKKIVICPEPPLADQQTSVDTVT